MAELANCTRCEAVFVKNLRDICPNCYKKEEEAFQKVYKFLRIRKNREATLIEIVEATGVEETLITKFVKEKRLHAADFPKLAYPCENCGANIVSGKLCISCAEELKKELAAFEETEKITEEVRIREASGKSTYYAMEKHKK
ncbi:TIGR03826 family flagellar region protein [Oceanobacillus damuensis]|uniref:TIGR03826 family flagellar region protein n=1 Tax=Oceanobacillus damuensis TaxID=937928 RepID=UPI00083276BE|nr:TIGR03826 family flagellar region protein [Oceanobacillus damuensis]